MSGWLTTLMETESCGVRTRPPAASAQARDDRADGQDGQPQRPQPRHSHRCQHCFRSHFGLLVRSIVQAYCHDILRGYRNGLRPAPIYEAFSAADRKGVME